MKIPLYFSHNHRHRYTAFCPLENPDLGQVGLVDLRLWDSASFQGWVHVQIYYATPSWSQLLDQDYKKRPSMTDLSSLGLTRVEKYSLHNGRDLRLLIAIFLDSRENDSTYWEIWSREIQTQNSLIQLWKKQVHPCLFQLNEYKGYKQF